MTDRARLTPVDVIFIGVGIAVFVFLAEPLYTVMDQQAAAGTLDTPEAYLFQLIPGALVITLMYVMYATAVGGSGT